MSDSEILLTIQALMSGVEWNPDVLDRIADVLEENGYHIADLEGE